MGRIHGKTVRVAEALRDKIVSGQWQAGMRLPPRQELERLYGVSRNTLQRVMDGLLTDGFIFANGRAGTFVADALPHQTRYALLIPAEHRPTRHRFWEALAEQARAINRANGRYNLSVYYGVDPGHRDESYDHLVEQIRTHRLAGLIFAASVQNLHGTPLLDEPGIPRVVIATATPRPDLPMVAPDHERWLERGVRFALERGRRHIAVLARGPAPTEQVLDRLTGELGIHAPAKWRLYHSPHETLGARHITQLLVDAPAHNRPDALLVVDDHFVEPVALGLADAGIAVPNDIEVVAHANFPYPSPSALPATRLGFDSREVLSHCLDAIDSQRRGEPPTPQVMIPARFEHECLAGTELAWASHDALRTDQIAEVAP